jgi:hypothetical protein
MSVELGAVYTITAPASVDGLGEVAVLNDTASANFVGYVTEISGLDSPEVRESADDIPEGDGGIHGSFFYGRRPFTFEIIFAPDPSASLNTRIDKFFRATNAMRADGTVVWTETGSVARRLLFRRQQPLRVSDRRPKRCLFAAVSANPRIESNTQNQASPGSITNAGNVSAPPTFVLTSPTNTITLTNSTYSETLTLTGLSGAGTVTVDFGARTVTATSGASNRYSAVSFPSSVWWELRPGAQTVAVSGATATSGVRWRDAWL